MTIMHVGQIVRAWKGASILQFCQFAWMHIEYCCSVTMTTSVSSNVIPIYLLLISYFIDISPCGIDRLKISHIWNCCALSCISTSMSSKKMFICYQNISLEVLVIWSVLLNDMHTWIIEGSYNFMCLSMVLISSTGSISGDSILVVAAST